MIHAMTSSYDKDFIRASSLNERLIKNNVFHNIFVEQHHIDMFKPLESRGNTLIHLKPGGGEGGLGRSGSMARFPCYLKMKTILQEGDTYAQLDSDVIIDEDCIPKLQCSEYEIKGFFNPDLPVHLERDASIPPTDIRFNHMSGMTICAGWRVFNESIPENEEKMLAIISLMLDNGFCPSEDVMLSYLLSRGRHTITNLFDDCYRAFHPNGDAEIHILNYNLND